MQTFRRQRCRLVCLICLSLAPFAALAQTTTPAPLPPEAQEAVNKGILAAKQQDYLLATRFFQDARKIAPQAPEIYYDLGLAESKIPGRELRAVAWFGAYLAASPNASNAVAVKGEIDRLDVKSQINLSRLIKTVQDAASQISDDDFSQMMRCSRVAGLWAGTSDMTAALKTIALSRDKDTDIGYKSIAESQAVAGDIAGAQKSAGLIRNGIFKSQAQGVIAVEQIKTGDIEGAEKTFAFATATADHIQDRLINGIQTYDRDNALSALAEVQARVGDIAGAQKTVALVKNDPMIWSKGFAQVAIVTAQRTAGDIAGAQKTVDLMPDGNSKKEAQIESWVRFPKLTRGPIQPVISDWLQKLDDDGSHHSFNEYDPAKNFDDWCPLNSDPFLDLATNLKSLLASGDPKEVFDAFYRTAKTIVTAQNVIDRMLKQQAKK